MERIKNENFIVVQGFMVNELNLKGNELLIYACIYGFSQAESQRFTGSLQYLAEWTNSSKQGVVKCLKSLLDKELIVKEDKTINNVKFCEYYTTKLHTPMQQSCTNNIDKNNIKKESKKDQTDYDVIINSTIINSDVKEMLYEFLKMRKLIKKPMTNRALKMLISKLDKLSTNEKEMIAILEQSIINSWQDIYPLKKTTESNKKQPFISRQYSEEELNSLFDNLDEVEL